jgi:predicted TIM-barrel fold metal-dependent hydrolase
MARSILVATLSSFSLARLRARCGRLVLAIPLTAAMGAALGAANWSRPTQGSTPTSPPGFEQLRKIDVHSHIYEDLPVVNAMLRRINLRVINVSVPATDGHLDFMHRFNAALVKRHPDIFSFASTFDLATRNEPDYGARIGKALDATFAQGAVMVKIWKEVGIELKRPDGSFLLPDDPVLDPVYAHLAARRKPLLAHLAEPREAWMPLDAKGVHYGYYSRNPRWHLYGKPGFPSHGRLMEARDRILAKHPGLVVIGAHIGSLEHDVDEVATRLDRYPNFHVEVSARTRDLTRQPSAKVRAFFLKYRDRILYGVDRSWMPHRTPQVTPSDAEREKFATDLEAQYRRDWDYYAGTGSIAYGADTVEALGLPPEVLEKFYWKNAERIIGVK